MPTPIPPPTAEDLHKIAAAVAQSAEILKAADALASAVFKDSKDSTDGHSTLSAASSASNASSKRGGKKRRHAKLRKAERGPTEAMRKSMRAMVMKQLRKDLFTPHFPIRAMIDVTEKLIRSAKGHKRPHDKMDADLALLKSCICISNSDLNSVFTKRISDFKGNSPRAMSNWSSYIAKVFSQPTTSLKSALAAAPAAPAAPAAAAAKPAAAMGGAGGPSPPSKAPATSAAPSKAPAAAAAPAAPAAPPKK